jgi:transcriptional regulator with XRE-family HTH domain
MVAGTEEPAVRRRRLRAELRKLRLETNLTQRDVAEAMDWSTSKVIRIENGTVGISVNDLRALLDYYGVTEKQRVDSFLDMARSVRRDRRESWSEFRDVVSPEFSTYLSFESSASTRRNFEPLLVPGLLQTEDYARAVLADTYQFTGRDIDQAWQVRLRRQEVHEREKPPRMWFVLDEAVIRRKVGRGNTMRRQLEQLKEWSSADHITLWVVPFSAGAHPGLRGPFVVLEFAEAGDDDLVFLEHATGDTTTRDNPEETGPYLEVFYALERVALSEDDSVALIDEVMKELGQPRKIATASTKARG